MHVLSKTRSVSHQKSEEIHPCNRTIDLMLISILLAKLEKLELFPNLSYVASTASRGRLAYLVDRYSERAETAEQQSTRVRSTTSD